MYKARSLSQAASRNICVSKRCFHQPFQNHKNLRNLLQVPARGNATQSGSTSSGSYVAGTVAVAGLVCGGSALYAKFDNKFRQNLENNFPFIKPALDSLYGELNDKRNALPEEKDLSIPFDIKELDQESAQAAVKSKENESFAASSDVVVINALDSPGVSSLDLDISKIGSKKKKNEQASTVDSLNEDEKTTEEITDNTLLVEHTEGKPEDNQSVVSNESEIVPLGDVNKPLSDQINPDHESSLKPETHELILDESAPLTAEELANLSDIVDHTSLEVLLEATTDYVSEHVKNYVETKNKAASSMHDYIQSYVKAISSAQEEFWEEASHVEKDSQVLIDDAIKQGSEVKEELVNFKELIQTVMESGSSEIAEKAMEILEKCKQEIQTVADNFDSITDNLEFVSKVHSEIENAPENIKKSLRSAFPDLVMLIEKYKNEIDISSLPPKDALIGFILKKAELLKAESENMDTVSSSKLNELLEEQKLNLQQENKNEIEKIYLDQENQYQKQVKQLEEEYEREILAQLKRQAIAHNEHLNEQLASQSTQLSSKHQKEMEDKIKDLREKNQLELEKQLAFIHGIQTKISEVVDMDNKQRRIQELFVAAQALNATLKETLLHGRTRTLMPEMLSVLNLAGHNAVIEEIISCLPEEAATLGVVPEKELISRFDGVKEACKKVALIGEEGGAIPLYFLSYLKSLFVFSAWYKNELDKEIDLDELGPYEILAKADYFIQRGDLEQATKFMSQLKGVSRKLCSDWLKEARLFLETRQTAKLLLAYASSMSVSVD